MTTDPARYDLNNLPASIWIPNYTASPPCYQGSPAEMVQSIAREMGARVRPEDAVDFLIQDIGQERGITIEVPSSREAPLRIRAGLLVMAMLVTGYARETPSA